MFNTGNCPSVPIVANLDGNNGNNWNDGSWLWFLIVVFAIFGGRAASQDRQNALLTTAMTAQTNQIINAVNPAPIPAYTVPNPNAYAYGCGCNTGCSC